MDSDEYEGTYDDAIKGARLDIMSPEKRRERLIHIAKTCRSAGTTINPEALRERIGADPTWARQELRKAGLVDVLEYGEMWWEIH